eukprot:2998666-Amphidinium_carterae.2
MTSATAVVRSRTDLKRTSEPLDDSHRTTALSAVYAINVSNLELPSKSVYDLPQVLISVKDGRSPSEPGGKYPHGAASAASAPKEDVISKHAPKVLTKLEVKNHHHMNAIVLEKKWPEGRRWSGTTWVHTKVRLDFPICPAKGKPYALMDSGASHMLLPVYVEG